MKLSELFISNPDLRLAKAEDNEGILEFFHSLPMAGKGLQLNYDRSPDFFAFLQFQSEDYFVFLLMMNNKIQGVGTLVIRPGFINGQETMVGYLGDLRIKPGKKNAVNWRKFYRDLLQKSSEIEEFQEVKYFETVVIDSNAAAKASLVMSKKSGYIYHELTPYKMINIYGKKPWSKVSNRYEVRMATANDQKAMEVFWYQEERKKQFGQPELLAYALKNWDHFKFSDIVLAFDQGKIVGMSGLWIPETSKRIYIRNYPFTLSILTKFLRLRSSSFPKAGEELRPLYMTHLNYHTPDVLTELIQFILKLPRTSKYHMISLTGYDLARTEEGTAVFLSEKVPMTLYQVYNSEKPELKLCLNNSAPGFEMALV